MAVSSIGNYNNVYDTAKTSEASELKMETTSKASKQEYLKSLQKQVPYTTLEVGSALSMQRDKRAGVITVNPKLLEKMQSDPEAAAQYTQKLKDIERAERTANAYYNSLGGCVERTSHWYVDEDGNHYHFAYTRRDDRLNKKIREETKKNMENHIEKTRKNAREKAAELKEIQDKKAEELKKTEKQETQKKKEEDIIENKLTVNEPLLENEHKMDGVEGIGRGVDLEV